MQEYRVVVSRVITSQRFAPVFIKSKQERIVDFAETRQMLSVFPFSARYATKAAVGGSKRGNTGRPNAAADNKDKRKKETKLKRVGIYNFDPNATKKSNQYFETRPRINLDGQMGDVANVGWLDIPKTIKIQNFNQDAKRFFASKAGEPKIIARNAKINKRTGELKVKALGQSIGSVGGNIGQAAARAVGIVLDPSGRMRCPPGVPAANQFTDEIGSNCFDFTPAIGRAVMEVIKKAGQKMFEDIRAIDSALPLVSDGSGGVSSAPKATMDRVRRGLASSTGRVVGTILGPDGRAIPSPDFERDVAELTATAIPIDPKDYESVFDTLLRAAYPDKTETEIRRLVKTAVQRQTMRDKTKSDIQDFLDLADELGVTFDENDPASVQDAIAQIIGVLQSTAGGGWGVDLSDIYGANPGDKDFAKKMIAHRARQLKMVTDYLATDPQKFGLTFDDLDILVKTKYAGKFENLEEAIIDVMSGRKELSEVFPPGSMEEGIYLAVGRKFEGLQQQEAGMFIGLINQRKKYPQLTSKMSRISYVDFNDPLVGDSDAITWASENGTFEVGINPMRPLFNNEALGSNADGFTLFEPDGGMGTEVAKLTAISRSLDVEGARRIRDEYLASTSKLADLQDAIDSGNEYVQRYVERSQGTVGQSIHVINHEMIHGRQILLIHNYLSSIPGITDQYTNRELMELTEGLLSGRVTFPSVFGRDWDYASIISNSDWLAGAIDDLPEVMQVLIGKNAGGKYAMDHYFEAAFLAPFVNGDPGNIKELYLPLSELYAQIEEMDRAGETNSTKCQAALRVFNQISKVYNSGDDNKFTEAKEHFRVQSALVFAEMQAEVAAGVEAGFIKRTPEIDAFLGPLNVDTDITTDFGKVNPDAKPIISLTKESIKKGIKDSIARQVRRRKNRKIIETDGLLPDDLYITMTGSGMSSLSTPDSDAFFDGISAFPSRVDVSQMGSTVHNHIMDNATSQQKQILDGNWREAKWNTSDPVDWSRALQSNPDSVVNSIENQLIPFIDLVDSSEMPTNVVVEVHVPPNYVSEVAGTTIAIDKHHTGIIRSTDDFMDDVLKRIERQAELDRIKKEKDKVREDRELEQMSEWYRRNPLPLPIRGEPRFGQNYDAAQERIERERNGTSWDLPSTPQRLMVTVEEGQIGLPDNTPGTNRGEIGALILPPGEIEIIGKTTDGVSIGKIVSQKRADEQLRGLKQILRSLGENETRPLGQRIVAKRSENRIDRHSELTRARVAKPAVLMELDSKRSTIANKIEYDPQTRTLTVSYRNGQKREFQNVPYGRLRDAGTADKPDKLIRELESGPEKYTPRKGSTRNRGLSSSTSGTDALIRESLDSMPDDDDAYDEKWQNYLASLRIEPSEPRKLVKTSTVEEAIMALLDGHDVDMPDVAGAHTLIEDLAKMISTLEQMVEDGEIDDSALKNFVFDLCQVTVKGTSAFCLGNKGIPRFMMPQAAGQVVPGSAAERLLEKQNAERLAKGEKISDAVEGTEDFLAYLLEKGGIAAGEPERVRSDKLKATQRDMQGHTVAGMLGAKKAGKYDPSKKPIFVSRDGYVVDGHHRWAATLGADFEDGILGNDHLMNVIILDAPISQILRLANEWTEEFGIAKKPVAKRSDVDSDFSSSVVRRIKERAGLSSSTSLVDDNLSVLQERASKANERVDGLENALDVLKRTGEWRGEEFGVIISTHVDLKGDAGKFDADTPPVNISKEEIEKRFGSVEYLVGLAEEKLDLSKKEIVLSEHLARTKQVRTEQNTIDIEDLTPEDFQLLLDEYKSLTPEDYGGAAIHVGQSELDGGILDPSKTTGGKDIGAVGGAGNTGALNEDQISKLKRNNDGLKDSLTSAESILKSLNDGEKTYTPKDAFEASYLNRLLGVDTTSLGAVGFEQGTEYDLSKMNSAGALSKINSELDLIKPQIKKNEETLGAIQGAGKFGFVSAYPASEGITTSGYFGRNAGSVIPKDIATYRTDLEAKLRKRPQYDDVQDRTTFDRWMSSLRGSAYLVTDPSVISDDLGPSSMGEKQILGKVKPVFGVSAPVKGHNPLSSERARQDEWGHVASALMARAIRLEKEGKEVNIENVLAARKGEPLRDVSQISRSGGLKSSTSTGRTAEILSRAKEKGIDIDYWEREKMPKFDTRGFMTGGEQLERHGYINKLTQAAEQARAQGNDDKAEIINQLIREVKAMTPEELDLAVEDALKRLPPQFSQQVSVQVEDPFAVVNSGRYLTVHEVDKMDEAGARGLSERGNFGIETIIRSRSNTEQRFLNIDPEDISQDTTELRPASGFVTSRMSEESRAKKLIEQYGPGVEIQHPYGIGETASKNNGDMSAYGASRIILNPEVAERSLVFQGDSISDTGSNSPALRLSTADDSPYRGQWFNPVSILYADRTGDMDSIASPGGNLPRDGRGAPRYQEAMILGSFDTPDIAAIVVSPAAARREYGKSSHDGMNIRYEANVTSLIQTAQKHDEFEARGIDLVMDSSVFPLDEVEPFNHTMTQKWVQGQIDSGKWKGVTFDEIVIDEKTTPYEAFLRYINKTKGVGSESNSPTLFDHPNNEPGNNEKNKVNLSSMIETELKRIESVKSKKKTSTERSGGLSSQTGKPSPTTDRTLDEVAKIEPRDINVTDDPRVRPSVIKITQKSWDGKDIYQTDDAGDALALIAAGHYVEMTHKEGLWKSLLEFEAKWKEVSKGLAEGDKLKTLNACLFMKTTNGITDNMFCRNHHDIARLDMPQVSGYVGDEKATIMRAWVSGLLEKRGGAWDAYLGDHKIDGVDKSTITKERWGELHDKWLSKTETPEERAEFLANTHLPSVEPDAIEEFKTFLREKGIPVSEGERVDVDTLNSTQNELVMDKISGISNKMLEGYRKFQAKKKEILASDLSQEEKDAAIKKALDKFKSMPQMLPIVVSSDGYIFDGHHRAFARHIFEGQLTEEELKEVKEIGFAINRADSNISELLKVGKVYQDHMDIPAASGTGESNLWKDNPGTALNTVISIDEPTWNKHKGFIFDNVDEKIDELDPTAYWKPRSPAVGSGTQSNEPKRIPSKGPARSGGLSSQTGEPSSLVPDQLVGDGTPSPWMQSVMNSGPNGRLVKPKLEKPDLRENEFNKKLPKWLSALLSVNPLFDPEVGLWRRDVSPNKPNPLSPQFELMTGAEKRTHMGRIGKILEKVKLSDEVTKNLSLFDKNNTNARDNAANIYLHSVGVDLNDAKAVEKALTDGFADWMSTKNYSEIETLSEVVPNEWDNYLGIGPRLGTVSPKNLSEAQDIQKAKKATSGLASRTTIEKVDQGPSVLTHGKMPDGTPVVADIKTLKLRFGSTHKEVEDYFKKTHGVKIKIGSGIFKGDVPSDKQILAYGALQALDDVLNNLDAQQLTGRDALTVSFLDIILGEGAQGLFGPDQKWWSRAKLGQNKTSSSLEINLGRLSKQNQSSPEAVSEGNWLQGVWREVITPSRMSDNMTSLFAQLGIPDGFELRYPGEDSPDLPEWERVSGVVKQRLAYAVMVHELGHYLDFSQREDSDAALEPAMMGLGRFLMGRKLQNTEATDVLNQQIWSSSTPGASPIFTDAPSPSVYGLANNQEKLAEGFLSWFTLMGSTRSSIPVDGTLTEDLRAENVRASESADFRKAVSDIVTPLLDKLGPRVKSAEPFAGASQTSETTKLPPTALLFAILPLVDMLKDKNSASAKMGRRYKRRITTSDQKSAERNQESKEMCCS